jgi:transcriptional regulator with XRE-family HTH domain
LLDARQTLNSSTHADVVLKPGNEPSALAHRIRQLRCAKGLGPDDLAARAKISRTALYQIETGKTTHPRSGTLFSIARALGVEADELFQDSHTPPTATPDVAAERVMTPQPARLLEERKEQHVAALPVGHEPPRWLRDLELEVKFRRLLASPFRDGLAAIVEQTFLLLPADQRDAMI